MVQVVKSVTHTAAVIVIAVSHTLALTGRVALLLTHMVKMVPLLKLFVALMELVVRFVILIKRCI
ncbi:hypothetical protein APR64_11710 [Enterobacter hormaechei]|nr:hypothetical protein AXJ76_09980 [Enterobacter cloacae]AWQ43226.1 hypothetical protein BET69_09635 [Enterobacter hormaechei]KJL67620.1 hypothetical protein SS38_20620 [Enterobacter hormaechei subsp. xiangfangensis]AWQ57440.1 hypothetical protein CAL61_09635 [Enterobacter hormaechei]KJM78370.1 hypothetical protein SS16_09080 [Enterobacter hormaechei subsp. xiangfangensis]